MAALSYVVFHCIVKTNKPFTTGEELILLAYTDICSEVLRELAAQIPLSACTVGRRIEDMAEDIETQLLERIVTSPWCAIHCDESTDIANKAVLLVFF